MWTRKNLAWIVLIILSISIKTASLFPNGVELYYSNGIYPVIARTQRVIFGWIPISIGDILYAAAFIYLVSKMYVVTKRILSRRFNRKYFWHSLRKIVAISLGVYVLFNLLWGLNYNRLGIAHQLQLPRHYSSDDLAIVMQQLVLKLNSLEFPARNKRSALQRKDQVFSNAIVAYRKLSLLDKHFSYPTVSVKPSLYSYLGNYLGFTGYYNPFTGEAQVNTTVPVFSQPFATCHEIGHQLGYAKESEANFTAYLAGRSSDNAAVRYSVYFDLYFYGRRYLYISDSLRAKKLDSLLVGGVKKDYREMREFWDRHANTAERVIDLLYGQYLKANEQPSGKISYNEVIIWLIAYYKKHGTI